MNAQLEILLQIQDLHGQIRDLSHMEASRAFEEQEFHIDGEKAAAELTAKIGELESELADGVRARYERVKGRGRVVVPVVHETCYGCFVSLPTSRATEMAGNQQINTCDNCGRFLYVLG